jgi:GNAT superfamily N-acetyltransferase
MFMIRPCDERDFEEVLAIINDGAQAYRSVIPADRWHEPYMSEPELQREIAQGVVFWGYEHNHALAAVMGIQEVGEVTLIRHAYVHTTAQRNGFGSELLAHLRKLAKRPLLIGTWADAAWAIHFYEKHGFQLLTGEQKDSVLPKYWKIPQRQVETSVVLASPEWLQSNS